jgi:uncharacterized protein YbbC (DUF1343 family)
VLGAEWMDPRKLIKATEGKLRECGLTMREYRWGKTAGVLLSVESIKRYRPAAAGMTLLNAIRRLWPKQLAEGAREEWLTKLMGGVSYDPSKWGQTLSRYRKLRVNLY